MKKFWIVVVVVLALIALWSVVVYNSLVNADGNIQQAYARIDSLDRQRTQIADDLETRILTIGDSIGLDKDAEYKEMELQLEDTEKQVAAERAGYGETVRTYNESISRFPSNMFAKMFGFRPYDDTEAGR